MFDNNTSTKLIEVDSAKKVDASTSKAELSWEAPDSISIESKATSSVPIIIAGLIVLTVFYLLTKDKFGTVILFICSFGLIIYANLKPKTILYSIKNNIISIGNKTFNVSEYKSFFVIEEAQYGSINLMPLKRFSVSATLIYPKDMAPEIEAYFSDILPIVNRKQDMVDKLLKYIRF